MRSWVRAVRPRDVDSGLRPATWAETVVHLQSREGRTGAGGGEGAGTRKPAKQDAGGGSGDAQLWDGADGSPPET